MMVYLCLSLVLIVRFIDSCCMRERRIGCDNGYGVWEKILLVCILYIYIIIFRFDVVKVWKIM